MRSSVSVMGVVPGGTVPAMSFPLGGACGDDERVFVAGAATAAAGTLVAGGGAPRFAVIGSRVMWQSGRSPGARETTWGGMGQSYLGAGALAGVPCGWARAQGPPPATARDA